MAVPASKKTVKLRIKVPANVIVETELVRTPANIDLSVPAGKPVSSAASVLEMDLTSLKTSEWLRKKTVASSDCSNCCCVRG